MLRRFVEGLWWFSCVQVGSRRVIQATGIFMMVFGVFGKFGALLVTIPDPVIGGVFLVMFGWSPIFTIFAVSSMESNRVVKEPGDGPGEGLLGAISGY